MKAPRQFLFALLVLLQAIAPYLHAHAAPSAGAVLHLHLSAGASAVPKRMGAVVVASADTRAGWRDAAALSALVSAPVSAAHLPDADVDEHSFEMPVEWLRGQPVLALPVAGADEVRAPPVAVAIVLAPLIAPQPGSSPRFAVFAYPAIAPPHTPASG